MARQSIDYSETASVSKRTSDHGSVAKGFLRTQGRTCYWCGRRLRQGQITLDHITPRSKGGTDHPSNLVPSCAACNNHKDSYDLSAWLSRLEHIVNRLRESLVTTG